MAAIGSDVLATASAAGADLQTGATLMIVGMGVVFAALALIMGVIFGVTRAFREPPAPARPPEPLPASSVTPEVVAVLTAAACVALGGVRVTRISPVAGAGEASAWVSRGRQSLMASHKPRRPDR